MADRLCAAKAILFDHDDTLVRTREIKWAHHKYVAKEYYGKILQDDEILPHWGRPLGQLACALYGTEDVEGAMLHIEMTRQLFPKSVFEATATVVSRLRTNGKVVGVVTATTNSSFSYDCQTLELPPFDYTQTADDTEYHKPDPRVFDPALAWMADRGIDPHEVTYIGDGLHDMHAAREAGLDFVGVTTGLVSAEEFSEHGIESVSGLHELIANPGS